MTKYLSAISEFEILEREITEHGKAWTYNGPEYSGWKIRVTNAIRRNYESPESAKREEEFLQTSTHALNYFDESITQSHFNKTKPRIAAWVAAQIEDLRIRKEQPMDNHSSDRAISPLRIIVGHDGDTSPRRKLVGFISALGAIPVIAEEEPKLARSVADHVDAVMKSCQYGIAIATKENSITQGGSPTPRQNVIDEISHMRERFGSRWMIVLENDVVLPSNQAEHVRANFAPQSMDRALTQIVIELRGNGFLKIGS